MARRVHEQLAYATRLLNQAAQAGGATTLRDWLVGSDMDKDPRPTYCAPTCLEVGGRHRGRATAYLRTRRRPWPYWRPCARACRKGVLAQQTGGQLAGPAVGPSRGPARGRGRFIEEMVAGADRDKVRFDQYGIDM